MLLGVNEIVPAIGVPPPRTSPCGEENEIFGALSMVIFALAVSVPYTSDATVLTI